MTEVENHTVAQSWPYPDGTHKTICTCGWETTPSADIEVLNFEFHQHRIARGAE